MQATFTWIPGITNTPFQMPEDLPGEVDTIFSRLEHLAYLTNRHGAILVQPVDPTGLLTSNDDLGDFVMEYCYEGDPNYFPIGVAYNTSVRTWIVGVRKLH
jgi:hypothetical protein